MSWDSADEVEDPSRSDSNAFMNRALSDPNGFSLADLLHLTCDKYPDNMCFINVGCDNYPAGSVTFSQFDKLANKVSRFFAEGSNYGLPKGHKAKCVAMYMQNSIEFVAMYMGLCKAGITVAFINNSIKDDALVHSLKISESEAIVYCKNLYSEIGKVRPTLEGKMGIKFIGVSAGLAEIFDGRNLSEERLPRYVRKGIKFTDNYGYVYTSGTTGLPKAVNVTHLKQWNFARGYNQHGADHKFVLYSSGMPLYHSAASGIGTGMVWHYGCCQVIRNKFSAREWLNDVIKYKVTGFQYIGEICRYILNYTVDTPGAMEFLNKNQDKFNLVMAVGNGLSGEIWEQFQTTFRVGRICEFYASTEGNGGVRHVVKLENLLKGNLDGIGCVGWVDLKDPSKLGKAYRLVKYDVDADELVYDKNGHLIDTQIGEPGEAIFAENPADFATMFVGYTDKSATHKKMLTDRDVSYVRTGDLLSVDEKGWIRFVDRIGDTFRWRGENVSTAEVASGLSKSELVAEVNVYGVQVPHVEGRAGCAATVLSAKGNELAKKSGLEAMANEFLAHAKKTLPSYSVPIFVRIVTQTNLTGTMKVQKVKMRNEGIQVDQFSDAMFFLDKSKNGYVPFTVSKLAELKQPHGLSSKL